MAKGVSVCVYGAKGGIGKSEFILNLAGVMANKKKTCLIIDLDLSTGAIACALNIDINKTIYNFCDDYNNNRFDKLSDYTVKYNDYIDVISSVKDPRQANKINPNYIDILIDKCIYKYDVVLIDTNSVLDEINVYALDKVDKLLLMTSNDLISLKNLKSIVTILQDNEFNNYKLILNESVNPNKSYFSLYDIKNIINTNVDYLISKDFYIKNIDNITMNGEIITLKNQKFKDYKIFNLIADDVLGGTNE